MRDTVITPVRGRFRLSGHPILTTLAHTAWISLLVAFLVISLSVSHTERRMSEDLNNLLTIFRSDEVPHSCSARTFPFFFVIDGEAVDVSDRNVDDWEKLRDAAVKSGNIKRPRTDSDVHSAKLPCGQALTPLEANTVVNLWKGEEGDSRFSGFDLSLWFARDDDKDAVYFRGQIESSAREALPGRLRLNLDHGDRPRQTFVIERDEEGALTFSPYKLYYSQRPAASDTENRAERHGPKFAGTWWDATAPAPGRTTQHFEIRLDNAGSITALNLSAERLSDSGRLESRVGTEAPVPLHEDIRSYQVTRLLPRNVEFQLFWFHEGNPFPMTESTISDGEPHEQGTRAQSEDARSAGHRGAGILNAFHRALLVTQGYEPCPAQLSNESTEIETCFRFSGTSPGLFGNRIRMSSALPAPDPNLEPRIVMVESTPVVGYRDIGLASAAVGFIGLLIWMFANASKQRREALDEENRARETLEERNASLNEAREMLEERNASLNKARETLEERNASLEEMNLALENYDRVFLHQAYGDVLELRQEIRNAGRHGAFLGSAQETKIDGLVKKMMDRLERSTEIFRYPAIIRDLISKFGHHQVSLREALEIVLVERKRDVRFEPILGTDDNPWIPGTCPSDSQDDEPDKYIVEAIETVLGNAYEYRTAGTPIIVSLRTEQADAIVEISNQGPTLPEEKLDRAFEFGTRFAGAAQPPPDRLNSGDRADSDDGGKFVPGGNPDDEANRIDIGRAKHLGIGLFITKQIVDGYRGHCCMENRPDGSGVTVMLRLPCGRGEDGSSRPNP